MNHQSSPPRKRLVETICDKNRVTALSDGVFAFAMTLLVLDIDIPAGLTRQDLLGNLTSQLPHLLTYLVSFLVIGLYWDVHQRAVRHIERCDEMLVWLNLLSLLFVTFIPGATAFVADYPKEFIAVFAFGLNASLIGFSTWILWRHASYKNRLLDPNFDPWKARALGISHLLVGMMFLIPLLLFWVSPYLVFGAWFLLIIGAFAWGRLYWHRMEQRTAEPPE